MKTILIVDKVSLQIQSKYQAEQADQSRYGGPWGDPSQTAHLECPQEVDADCAMVVEVAEAIDPETQLPIPAHLEVQEDAQKASAKLAASREAKLDQIRELRKPKLERVDQLVNLAVLDSWTAGEKTELKNYRAALLNITEPFKADSAMLDAQDLEALEWPIEPSEV
jgi:hypothetical protein